MSLRRRRKRMVGGTNITVAWVPSGTSAMREMVSSGKSIKIALEELHASTAEEVKIWFYCDTIDLLPLPKRGLTMTMDRAIHVVNAIDMRVPGSSHDHSGQKPWMLEGSSGGHDGWSPETIMVFLYGKLQPELHTYMKALVSKFTPFVWLLDHYKDQAENQAEKLEQSMRLVEDLAPAEEETNIYFGKDVPMPELGVAGYAKDHGEPMSLAQKDELEQLKDEDELTWRLKDAANERDELTRQGFARLIDERDDWRKEAEQLLREFEAYKVNLDMALQKELDERQLRASIMSATVKEVTDNDDAEEAELVARLARNRAAK
jgi:hypothetical protein